MLDDFNRDNDNGHTVYNSPVPDAPEPEAPRTRNGSTPIATPNNAAPTWTNNPPVQPAVKKPAPVYIPRVNKMPAAPPPMYRESAARARVRRRRVRGRAPGGEWAWVIIAAAMLGVVITISMSVFYLMRTAQAAPEILPTATVDLALLPTPVDGRTATGGLVSGQLVTLADGSDILLEPWDGESRFTILVMGLDRRPGEGGLAYRTDTMMLVSIDPQTNAIGILSIPRDLYVAVPGYNDYQRVNTAMVLGELRQPGTGPTLAMQTVQYNLGIRVNDYLAADFDAFIELVDILGGIDVTTDYTIDDPYYPDMNYGYDPFYLPAGSHHLSGRDALRFARTRHGDSDFLRAERQQQVIYAVRDRVLDPSRLAQLILQAPNLLSSWEENVYTGLSLDQMVRLAWYIKDIPTENIHTGVIDYRYAIDYMTSRGEAVLIPNRDSLGDLMVNLFGANYSQ